MNFPSRPWSTPYHPARVYLFTKGLFVLLALDLWTVRIPGGSRYGFGGFNVAHFEWMDRFLPLPTPALFVGVLLLIGLMCIKFVCSGRTQWETAAVLMLYTFTWAVSLLDNFQHHYLISWLLAWCVLLPDVPAAQARKRSARVFGPGFPMLAATCAIVYTFTAITKSASDWRAGHVLARILGSRSGRGQQPPLIAALDSFQAGLQRSFGLTADSFWLVFAYGAILLQITLVIAYVLATERDARRSKVRSAFFALGLCGTFGFHLFLEMSGRFRIQHFSYYMMWISFVVFAPEGWVARLAGLVGGAGQAVTNALVSRDVSQSRIPLLKAIIGSALLVLVGAMAMIPGALWSTGLWAGASLAMCGFYLRRKRLFEVQSISVAAAAGAFALFFVMILSSVQYDYFILSARIRYDARQYDAAREALLMAQRVGGITQDVNHGLQEVDARLAEEGKSQP